MALEGLLPALRRRLGSGGPARPCPRLADLRTLTSRTPVCCVWNPQLEKHWEFQGGVTRNGAGRRQSAPHGHVGPDLIGPLECFSAV